jgi:hypothetical protein
MIQEVTTNNCLPLSSSLYWKFPQAQEKRT